MSDVEIVTKLSLDSVADRLLEKIRDEFDNVAEGEHHAQEAGESFFGEMVHRAHEFGIDLAEQAHKVAEFAESFVDVAAEGNKADTALAGMIATANDGMSWDAAFDKANAMGDEFDELAEKAGVSGQSFADAFQTMVEIGGAGKGQLEGLKLETEDLARIAGVLGKDTGALAREWSMMGEGVLRTRGQLFQLLKSTGIFGQDAKKAAEGWAKLTDEERSQRMDYALTKLSSTLKDAKPSFNQLKTSLSDMYETAKEKLGEPLMYALIPVLESVKAKLEGVMPKIAAFAQKIGPDVAKWVGKSFDLVSKVGTYVADHYDDIVAKVKEAFADVKSAFEYAKDVFDFVVAHKEVFMAIAAAWAAKQGGEMLGGAAGKGIDAVKGLNMSTIMSKLSGGFAGMKDAAAGALIPLLEMAPAMIALGSATYIALEIIKKQQEDADTAIQGMKTRTAMMKKGDVAGLESERSTALNTMQAAAERGDTEAAQQAMVKFADLTKQIDLAKGVAAAAADYKDTLKQEAKLVDEVMQTAAEAHTAAADAYAAQVGATAASEIVDAYNTAIRNHDDAAAQYAAGLIASSANLQTAIQKSGLEIEGGFDLLGSNIMAGTNTLLSDLDQIMSRLGSKGNMKPPNMNMSLSGGGAVTVNVHQDYRDQDPDRVAIVFKRDLERTAARRLQSAIASPFGT